jgi:hypothetical protein
MDRKRTFALRSTAEYKTLEAEFAEMAAKGWMIDKINPLSCEYRKAKKRNLRFCVDLLPQISGLDYPHNETANDYRTLCEDAGWTFVCASRARIIRTIVPGLARLVFDGIRGESGNWARLPEKTLAEWKADDGYENDDNGTLRLLLYGKTVVEMDVSAEEIGKEKMLIQLDAGEFFKP